MQSSRVVLLIECIFSSGADGFGRADSRGCFMERDVARTIGRSLLHAFKVFASLTLCQASKLYHQKDYEGMLGLLLPLHLKTMDVCAK